MEFTFKLGFALWHFWALFFSGYLLALIFGAKPDFAIGCFVGFWGCGAILVGSYHYLEWSEEWKKKEAKNGAGK